MTKKRLSGLFEKNSSGVPFKLVGSSPASLTYPPKGKRERTYSVPPFFIPKSFFPKPRENLSTLTPTFFSTNKCPNSWTIIRMLNTIKTMKNVNTSFLPPPLPTYQHREFRPATVLLCFYAAKAPS